jgi:flagellar motor switch protein FliG
MDRQRQTIELLQLLGEDVTESVLAQLEPGQASRIRAELNQKSATPMVLRPRHQRALLDDFQEFFQFAVRNGRIGPVLHQETPPEPEPEPAPVPVPEPQPVAEVPPVEAPEHEPTEGHPVRPPFHFTGDPLHDIRSLTVYQLAQALETEQPRTTAILLGTMSPQTVADVLSLLKDEYQRNVVKELSREQHAPQVLIERIARATLQRGSTLPADPPTDLNHADRLAEVLRSVPKIYRMNMLAAVEEQDSDLSKALLKKMYRFDDIASLPPRTIQRILGEVDGGTLTTALFNVTETLKEAVLGNLSRRARQAMEEELSFRTSVPEAKVLEAREAIAEIIARIDQESE